MLRLEILQMVGQRSLDHFKNPRAETRRGGLRWRLSRVKRRHLAVAPVGLDVAGRNDGHEQERFSDAASDRPLQLIVTLQIVTVAPDA